MIFMMVKGSWSSAKNKIPGNNDEKLYAVTLGMTKKYYRMVAEEQWRYFNDRWEMYHEGEWKPLRNNAWEVVAYIPIHGLEPCELN